MTPEHERLAEAREGTAAWKHWGPYVSLRQWGTVREDYSADGEAWTSFPFDRARSRASHQTGWTALVAKLIAQSGAP